MTAHKRAVAPYIVPIDDAERSAYDHQRIRRQA
jgi:hypothetical protein